MTDVPRDRDPTLATPRVTMRRRSPDSPAPRRKRDPVTKYKIEQRQITFRGRVFHFVSYDGARGGQVKVATAPAWFLMSEGTRWEVMPHDENQAPEDVDRQLTAWLERTIT